jgi:hypothetical protein
MEIPNPLLNELKLAAQLGKGVELDAPRKFYIGELSRVAANTARGQPSRNGCTI